MTSQTKPHYTRDYLASQLWTEAMLPSRSWKITQHAKNTAEADDAMRTVLSAERNLQEPIILEVAAIAEGKYNSKKREGLLKDIEHKTKMFKLVCNS